ncbi:MAG TPA: patatin-like phospholipase family protein [Methylomirabilota bacterium]|nr:patatin-like phospholipase family protein [Methylomirabilota bacterium]
MQAGRAAALGLLLLALGACVTPAPVNVRLAGDTPPREGYRYDALAAGDNSDDLFVILAFSGGGTRAAAFAFGVMEGLRDIEYQGLVGPRRLLDDVDVISSVSGGSFTAAYYALFPDEFFQRFPADFLNRNIEGALIRKALAPWNWLRLGRQDFDRIHLAVELYDETVFRGKTFADLTRKPYVILNATDMSLGRRFEFTQEQFDLLCSDVSKTKIAAGVAASSAFPGLLSPLTLKNFAADGCTIAQPEWIELALAQRRPLERHTRARDLNSYRDPDQKRPWIHLLDGGLADNIGLRGPDVALRRVADTSWSVLSRVNEGSTRKVLVIAANAKTKPPKDWDQHESAPGLFSVLGFVSSGPMDNYSFDTVERIREFAREQNQEYAAWVACRDKTKAICDKEPDDTVLPPVDYRAVEVAFDNVPEERLRRCLENLPTSFRLNEAQVELLRRAGRRLLLTSPELAAAMQTLDQKWTPPDSTIEPALIARACPDTPEGATR